MNPITKPIIYPICPECHKNTLVGFARPNIPWTNDRFDYNQKTAELYCSNGQSNCNYRVPFSELTTPKTMGYENNTSIKCSGDNCLVCENARMNRPYGLSHLLQDARESNKELNDILEIADKLDRKELTKENIDEALTNAILKSKTMTPDNSAPLMTHDIEIKGCNGLSTCEIHHGTK